MKWDGGERIEVGWNGVGWDEVEWNGMRWSGVEWNAVEVNFTLNLKLLIMAL